MKQSPLLSGLLYSMIFMLIGTFLISLLMMATNLQETSLFGYTMSVHGVAMFIGGIVSGKRSGTRGWYHGGMLGIFYCLIVWMIGFLAYDTGLSVETLYLLGLTFGSGALGGILGINMKK
ncbi:TIGR04086 family membrane protein [Paenibacillus sp. NPDC056579]|uniref:TIGR04086 family membrane protein n=1 Tax=unclassified Paenibacillus TaxID=185978 RepID=UPI001EF98A27|nr:TIGR04086 family membrane protein [Paenibacillus sp. H1-7]ULL17829.1 TIGR04086 family membrane protein [Paenibacillus sp. H1-7]